MNPDYKTCMMWLAAILGENAVKVFLVGGGNSQEFQCPDICHT